MANYLWKSGSHRASGSPPMMEKTGNKEQKTNNAKHKNKKKRHTGDRSERRLLVFTKTPGTALSRQGVAEVGGAGKDRTHFPHAESPPSLEQQ